MSYDHALAASRAIEPYFYQAPVPPSIKGGEIKPFPFQYAGVEYCISRDNALIGDVPGLGKTAQGIMISNAIEAKSTLVVCPASLRLNWVREIWMWSTLENVGVYPIIQSSDGSSPDHEYVVISYDLLRNKALLDGILDRKWDHLILDEAHYLKDPRGNKRTRVICAPDCLPSVVGRTTMLSGTILPNQPIEVYNAARLLDWNTIDCSSLETFRNNYYDEGGGFVTITRGGRTETKWSNNVRNQPCNLQDLGERLRRHIMVRRLKPEVLPQLPPRTWHVFPLVATRAVRKAMKHPGWKKVQSLYEMNPNEFQAQAAVDGEISTARRELGEAKAPLVADYVDDMMNSGVTKLVVGAWHHTVLDYLLDRFRSKGYEPAFMSGRTSSKKKQAAVDTFQEDPACKIILGQVIPLGEGWTLHAAEDVILAEPAWVPGKNDQLLDRIHRIGQTADNVTGHIPVVPDTMDERILAAVIRKDKHIYDTLDRRW